MKRIVITGKNGYIANHIKSWLEKNIDEYTVCMMDVRSDEWENVSFAEVDVLVHTAGIVHQPDLKDWDIYYSTNVTLTERLAQKAKEEGIKQFIFFSTMAVYGIGKKLEKNVITQDTVCSPVGMYGKSKFLAEKKLEELEDENFLISIIRPPNVYGYKCKGNYISGFAKVVKFMPFIPYAYPDIKQSMIYIDNLTELVKLAIDERKAGYFMPQDCNPVSTVELLQEIAEDLGRNVKPSRILGVFAKLFSFVPITKKVYGGVEYSRIISSCFENKYVVCSFSEAMIETLREYK